MLKKIKLGGVILCYYLFAYYLPNRQVPIVGEWSRRVRQFLCKRIFARTGAWINVQRRVYFGNNHVELGYGSGLGANFLLQNSGLIVGDYVMIGPDVKVLGGGHRFERKDVRIGEQGNYPKTTLQIGDDVWIGNGVTILSKCKRIGTGAVIGASAVVTKDVPDYAVVGGNPARILRYRT